MSVLGAFFFNMVFNLASGLLAAKFLGPEQFGRFAVTLVIAGVIQGVTFEWIRFSTIRFYSMNSRAEQPELRATLDVSFRIASLFIAGAGLVIVALPMDLPPSSFLLGLACALAICNGLFDLNMALARARFLDRVYLRLMLTKNVLALVLVTGGAFVTGAAAGAIVGLCVSMAVPTVLARKTLADKGSRAALASRALALQCARYGVPIVAANLLYVLIPLTNRAVISSIWGYAETGMFSLAYDAAVRLLGALAVALDILLFQVAVRADQNSGREAAQAQVARNTATVFAVLLSGYVGLWLTLPSIEALIVPSEFHGAFSGYLSALLPGMFCFGMCNCAINATFQIDRKTLPLIVAALAGFAVNLALFALPGGEIESYAIARAQSWAFVTSFAVLIVFSARSGAHMPRLRDLLAACAGVGVMIVAVLPMRAWEPGLGTALAQTFTGVAVFGSFVAVFDIARLRSTLLAAIRGAR